MIEYYLTQTQMEQLKLLNMYDKLDAFVSWLNTKYRVLNVCPLFDTFPYFRLVLVEIDIQCKGIGGFSIFKLFTYSWIRKEMRKAGFADLIRFAYIFCKQTPSSPKGQCFQF